MTDARRIRMSFVDRLWFGSTVITGVGPVIVPDRRAIVAALTAFAAVGPDARVGLRFDARSSHHWIYRSDDLDRYIDSCVVQLPPGADDDPDGLLSRMTGEFGATRPVSVFLADRHVFVMISHAVGDSRLALALPAALIAHTQTGAMPDWATATVDPHPMRSALRHTFPNRAAVRTLLAERATNRARRAALVDDATPRSADGLELFTPMPVAVSEVGVPGSTRELQVWTRTHVRGAAHFATVLTLTAQALAEQGIACAPSVHMVYDLRRYLPRGYVTTGNFVGGVDLPVAMDDPLQVTKAVTDAAKVGHPLAAVAAAATLSALLRGRRDDTAQLVPQSPRAHLALSYVGPKHVDPTLPWVSGPEDCRYWSRVDPAGPTAMTLLVAVVGRRLQLSASFHASVFDPDAVRRALRAAHADPIGLLERALAPSVATGPADS